MPQERPKNWREVSDTPRHFGSDTYGFWRNLIIRLKFEAKLGNSEEIKELTYENLYRLWVDSQTA